MHRRLRALSAIGFALFGFMAMKAFAHASQVLAADGQPIGNYPLRIIEGAGSGNVDSVGQGCWVGIAIENKGERDICIPLGQTPLSTAPLLSLSVVRVGGGEEVSLPSSEHHRQVKGAGGLLVIPAGKTEYLQSWFVPWSMGEYEYTLVLENRTRTRKEYVHVVEAKTGLARYELRDVPIPYVWVGRHEITARIKVLRDHVVDKEYIEKVKDESLIDVRSQLDTCIEVATDSRLPLSARVDSLNALVEMRHMYAADALGNIERQSRDDALIHPHVVRALYDMAFWGAGYRELALLGEVARDKRTTESERVLCLDALWAFAGYRGKYDSHAPVRRVTSEDRHLAERTVEQVLSDLGLSRGEVEVLLQEGRLPPVGPPGDGRESVSHPSAAMPITAPSGCRKWCPFLASFIAGAGTAILAMWARKRWLSVGKEVAPSDR